MVCPKALLCAAVISGLGFLTSCERQKAAVTVSDTLVTTQHEAEPLSQTGLKDSSVGAVPAGDNGRTAEAPDTGDTVTSETASRYPLPRITWDESKWKTYTNARYGFSLRYPPELTVHPNFVPFHHFSSSWRTMASPNEHGSPVLSIPIVSLDGRTHHQRFYGVQLRVGVAEHSSACDSATNGERSIGAIVVGDQTFRQFSFSDAAMMQYVEGISYRTQRNGRCLAIEQVRTGSNYRDTTSAQDIPQAELNKYYFLAGRIVRTFRVRR